MLFKTNIYHFKKINKKCCSVLIATVAVSCLTGCGKDNITLSASSETPVKREVFTEEEFEEGEYTEADLEGILTHDVLYILSGSDDVALTTGMRCNPDIILAVVCAFDLDYTIPSETALKMDVMVDVNALEAHSAENDTETDEGFVDVSDLPAWADTESRETVKILVNRTIVVVDEETAISLASEGKVVWTGADTAYVLRKSGEVEEVAGTERIIDDILK